MVFTSVAFRGDGDARFVKVLRTSKQKLKKLLKSGSNTCKG
jgi:hypothetical protein